MDHTTSGPYDSLLLAPPTGLRPLLPDRELLHPPRCGTLRVHGHASSIGLSVV